MDDYLNKILECELGLLRGDRVDKIRKIVTFIEHIQHGEYRCVIDSSLTAELFSIKNDFKCVGSTPIECLRNLVNFYLSGHVSPKEHLEVLCIGIASLYGFIQANWIGPKYNSSQTFIDIITPVLRQFFNESNENAFDTEKFLHLSLSQDGEEICSPIVHAELLLLSHVIFSSNLTEVRTADWWLLRSTYIHQQVLDEQCFTLQELLSRITERMDNSSWICDDNYLYVLSRLEIARIHMHYGKVSLADREIKRALNILKMNINLTGAMGRRTYFQSKDLAQLKMNVSVERSLELEKPEIQLQEFPKDILLNDDVRMPHISFVNSQDGEQPDLLPLEQAVLLAVFVLKKKSQAKDHLLNEELLPFLNCLLSHPKVWSFQLSALHLRSRLECEHKRTIERSLLQTQILMNLNENKTPLYLKLNLFFCSYAPPTFIISSECASILVSVGSIQSALDIFIKLQMWDDVIACYNYLKLRHKTAEVIREQMKKGVTVKLLCYLGDATDDPTCFDRAWQLSNQRSAQAQRHWGMFYYNKKMYSECIDHLKLSLDINSLQVALWFRLGYACLIERKWEQSASAYRRYCALEPDNFEAWNNLAKAYILLDQKHRAYNALQEAIKCNYETWQVWDNLMAVSSDCGDFEEVIHCYHRILDLKDKHIDEQILTVLTTVILKNVKDCKEQPASIHRKKALELFGRITSKVMGNPTIWQLYGQLTSSIEDQTSITRSKALQYYQKAYTAAMQDPSWHKDYESIQKVLRLCEKLAEAHLDFVKVCSSTNEATSFLSSAKFAIANVIANVKQHMDNMDKTSITDSFLSDMTDLQKSLKSIQMELANIKSS